MSKESLSSLAVANSNVKNLNEYRSCSPEHRQRAHTENISYRHRRWFSRHSDSLETFCMPGLTIQNRVFYEWKQKNLGWATLALCMRKKTSKSVSLRELEPFQYFTIPLRSLQFHCRYVSLWEGFSEHCGLSPLRGPSAGAISGLLPSSLRGERQSVG